MESKATDDFTIVIDGVIPNDDNRIVIDDFLPLESSDSSIHLLALNKSKDLNQ